MKRTLYPQATTAGYVLYLFYTNKTNCITFTISNNFNEHELKLNPRGQSLKVNLTKLVFMDILYNKMCVANNSSSDNNPTQQHQDLKI